MRSFSRRELMNTFSGGNPLIFAVAPQSQYTTFGLDRKDGRFKGIAANRAGNPLG
jgi:hypothetical protein